MEHREVISQDGRYMWAEQGSDGNRVVYARDPRTGALLQAVWDSASYEAGDGHPAEPSAPAPTTPGVPPATGGAGYVEHATSSVVRPRLTREQIAEFVPSEGPFRIPGYETRGIRLTGPRDGLVHPLGMSYWPNVNNHEGRHVLRVLLSLDGALAVVTIDKATGQRVDRQRLAFPGTGEGACWSLTDPDLLYVPDQSGLLRFHVETHQVDVAVRVPGARQCHASADGSVYSLTVDGVAAVWDWNGLRRFPSPSGATFDECQVDKSGRWLLVKEKVDRGGRAREDNRIIDLQTEQVWTITDEDGAVGHSDMGYGYMVGEDDQTQPGGVFRRWDFTPAGPVNGGVMYHTGWTGMSRYISHGNARQAPATEQVALVSSSHTGDALRANELVVVPLDGSLRCRSIAPTLNDIGDGHDYWRKTRANLCPVGAYAAFTGNLGADRVDAFLVEL